MELAGEWWLPERGDRHVAGTLVVEGDGYGRLTLIGQLRTMFEEGEKSVSEDGQTTTISMTQASLDSAGVYPRIVGQVGARYLTLEDCFRGKRSRNLTGGLASETIHCGHVFDGLGFDAGEPLEFDGVAFQLKWLTHWLQESALEESHDFEGPDGEGELVRINTSVQRLALRTLPLEHGSLMLGHGFGINGDRLRERTLTQGHYSRIELDSLVPLNDLSDLASDLQDLVTMAVNRTAESEGTVELLHPEAHHNLPSGKSIRDAIQWHAPWTARDTSTETTMSKYDMLFTFEEFGGLQGIARWVPLAARHRSALGRVMATRYSPHMYLSDRLLNRAAAIEALDRNETGFENSTFATRLRRCAELAGEPFSDLVQDVDRWVQELKDDRDEIAHHYGRRLRHQTREQLFLSESAYWLFVYCIMRLAGAPDAAFDRASRHPSVQWTKRGLANTHGPEM